jgi:hypothetical protein
MESINEIFLPLLAEGEKILATRMRRMKDKTFKGSIFLEMSSVAVIYRYALRKTHTHTDMYTHIHTHIHRHVHMYIHTRARTCSHIRTHAHIHTHKHKHKHTHTQ